LLIPCPFFTNKIYNYPNQQRATTLWYHDHVLGITRLNIYAGLAGFYLIRDKEEESLPLPKARIPSPSVVPEFFGDTILVNGKVWPFLNVEPRKYRFRILNASNARFYRFKLDYGQPFFKLELMADC
jgi:spore coat protein A